MIDDTTTTQRVTVSRRTVMRAAAWSVPVIAVAAAVPLASASIEMVCPETPPGSEWETALEFGTLSAAGYTGWLNDALFVSDKDATLYATGTIFRTQTTFEAVAGTTYDFTLESGGVWASAGGRPTAQQDYIHGGQNVTISMGGVQALQLSTRPDASGLPGTQIPMSNNQVIFNPFAFSYAATATGPVTIVFRYILAGVSQTAGHQGNDRIDIQNLTITCV